MESSVLEDVSLPEGTVQWQSSSDPEEPRPTTSQAKMINTLGEVKMCSRSTKSVAFSGSSSAVRRRLEARLAEARLEQVRRDEELKLRTLALVAEQERRKLESQRIVLIAEAKATEASIIADAASELAEEQMSQTADMAPLLSTNEKVSAFLSVLTPDHEDAANVSRLSPDCLATQIHSGLAPSPVVAGTSGYSKPPVSVQGPAFSMASSVQANPQVAYSTVPASQAHDTLRYSESPVLVHGPAVVMASQVQGDNPITSNGTPALRSIQDSAHSQPPVHVYGPASVNPAISMASVPVHGSTVSPVIQVHEPSATFCVPVENAPAPAIMEDQSQHAGIGSRSPGEFSSCSVNDVAKLLVRCKGSESVWEFKFDGDPLDYYQFKRQVDDRILSVYGRSDPGHALHLLLGCTTGRAHKLIASCIMYPPERGLNEALSLLHKTFGCPQVAVRSFIDSICNGRNVSNTEQGLENFYAELVNCKMVLEAAGAQSILNSVSTAERVFMRLPRSLREKFAKLALDRGFEIDVVPFDFFIEFVEHSLRLVCSRFGRLLQQTEKGKTVVTSVPKFVQRTRTNVVQGSNLVQSCVDKGKPAKVDELAICRYCNARDHVIFRCEEFLQKAFTERKQAVKQYRLCFNCLGKGHGVKDCPSKSRCRKCAGRHHTLLHQSDNDCKQKEEQSEDPKKLVPADQSTSSSLCASAGNKPGTRLQVIPVCVVNNVTGTSKDTLCLLDSGSDCHLIDSKLFSDLDLPSRPMHMELQMANGSVEELDTCSVEFGIRGVNESEMFTLENVHVVPQLPNLSGSVPLTEDITRNPHLSGIEIPVISGVGRVQVIIGINTPGLHVFSEIRQDGEHKLWAGKCPLGWVLHGCDSTVSSNSKRCVNLLIDARADPELNNQCPCQYDYVDRSCDPGKILPSLDDERAEESMKGSCTYVNGHYQIGIPWKQGCPELPNNYEMALARLKGLGKRLLVNPELHSKYKAKIDDMISQGHAVEVSEDTTSTPSRIWYIPHHCVTSKFRVVFDCAAQFNNTSLNKQILQGPDNTNNLVGVITRFRKHAVAVVGDLRAMFLQVNVDPADQCSLRFLWWLDGDPRKPPKKYQLTVHCFGLTSSPSVAGFALRRAAEDNHFSSSVEAVQVVRRNIYVDDVLVSVADRESAIQLVKELDVLLGSAGFELAKLSSNRPEVLAAFSPERLAPCLNEINIYEDELPGHKALGLIWFPQSDVLGLKFVEMAHPFTRRGLLSFIMSVFDPLGMISPYLLPLKLLLQRLTKSGLGWDADIPEGEKLYWEKFAGAFHKLGTIVIPRSLNGLTSSSENQLHVFADASNAGIGAVSYLRTACNFEFRVSFIMGKSRVAPIRPLSTPRMELSAAVIAVRLAKFIESELDIVFGKIVLWSDSTTVLGYLRNTSKRRPIFETNRIKLIRELSLVEQWRWVETRNNPADLYSRGVSPLRVDKAEQWLRGPSFLLEPEDNWPCHVCEDYPISADEFRTQNHACLITCPESGGGDMNLPGTSWAKEGALGRLINRFSDLSRSVRVTAWLLKLKQNLLKRRTCNDSNPRVDDCITACEYDAALLALISLSQRQEFPGLIEALKLYPYYEIAAGKCGKELKKLLKPLVKYCPFVENDLMRLGGRLQRSEEPYDIKHPIVLPKKSHLTTLIVLHWHQKSGHNGAPYVINELRERFYVVGQERTVKYLIKSGCMACRNRRAKPGSQIMSPLPSARVTPGQRLFTVTGVDFMGPIAVKCNRNTLKRYCCLFTCMASRASHLEVAYDLTTGSFLMALRRFLATRGNSTKTIYCDNATNFIGAELELKRGLERIKRREICNELTPRGIEFKHSPPLASHQGGVWEAIIRLVRKAMTAIMTDKYFRTLSDEGLVTLFKEVELILNCRPLTRVSGDPTDFRALTPMTLLNGSMAPQLPMDVFAKTDGLRASYRATQLQADLFWQRWRREYLTMLQKRHKWLRPEPNIEPNTLVLVKDENVPRGVWPKGVVVSVSPDRDQVCRRAVVRMANGREFVRDIRKLCILEGDIN